MSWAARRRFIILLIIGAVVAAFLTVIAIATFYKTPTCSDGVQNQGEAGIDCGGPCPYLCTALEQSPMVLSTTALTNGGHTSVIALVKNKNAEAAAIGVPYHISLYDASRVLIQELHGTIDLPPGATVPIFIPNIALGKQSVAQAFLSIDESDAIRWFTMQASDRTLPTVMSTTIRNATTTPSISAVLANATAHAFGNVLVILLVHDAAGAIIGASQTIIPVIPAEGQATGVFTWNDAFTATPTSVDAVPVIPLSGPSALSS